MTYDDELDERRVPTMRSALEDFAEVLCRPVAKRLTAVVEWVGRLRRFEIDWDGFAVTRGGFFDWLGTPLVYKPDRHREPDAMIVSAVSIPLQFGGFTDPNRWRPWAKWWRGFDWSLESYLPQIQAQRGGIRMIGVAPSTAPTVSAIFSPTATYTPADIHEIE